MASIQPSIPDLNKYLSSNYYVPGLVLGKQDNEVIPAIMQVAFQWQEDRQNHKNKHLTLGKASDEGKEAEAWPA